jgi:phosphoglycerate dehydrogenase-like enzyme
MGVAWGMKVLACVEHSSLERAHEFEAMGMTLTTCDEVLANSDFVSVHVPLKPSTRGFIDKAAMAKMKPGAYLVNIARGGVVEEAALYEALSEGRLAGAGVDVHQKEGEGKVSPLAEFKNVILTPHIGASTVDSQKEIGEIVLETVDAFAAERLLLSPAQSDQVNA